MNDLPSQDTYAPAHTPTETSAQAPTPVAMPTTTAATLPMAGESAATVELFDPPLCCPTGLCGPTLDQTLVDANDMVRALNSEGTRVERYQMASHPHVFLKHPDVMRLVRERGMEAFPITVVAGRVVKTGAYPTRQEIDRELSDAK